MSNVTVFGNANLPAVNSISSALRNIQTDTSTAGGVTILKMDRTGHWVYGASETEVDNDSIWAVNPFSFTHGFIAWGEGEVLGEKMVSVTEPLPQLDPAPAAAKRGTRKWTNESEAVESLLALGLTNDDIYDSKLV